MHSGFILLWALPLQNMHVKALMQAVIIFKRRMRTNIRCKGGCSHSTFTKGCQAPKKSLTNLSGRQMGNTNCKACCPSTRMSFISSRYWKSSWDIAYLNTSLNLVESPRTEGFLLLEIASSNLIEDKWLWTFMATVMNCFNIHAVQAEKSELLDKEINLFKCKHEIWGRIFGWS